ncbi:ubl-1 [Symbiodinium natans]|uniref:Ubl-1 protein n=1 Tax=Symbiodinium natans TaxID=878477 RepID=A0A812V3L1_9DINO|nr:ubl-1 [Symbiodinium natans]
MAVVVVVLAVEEVRSVVVVRHPKTCYVERRTILDSAARLADCDIQDEATLFVSLELQGGGKKRKKKTYTKPKKIKHKRKKVKLAVLKFYKVDSNDKVTRLRRECPHETCGPGVFMAMHFNRYYCGKCHLTYLIKKEDK